MLKFSFWFILSTFIFFSCTRKCVVIFSGHVNYCLGDEYVGKYIDKPFSNEKETYRLYNEKNGNIVEIEWMGKTHHSNSISWKMHIQDILKKSEDIDVIKIDTFSSDLKIELLFRNENVYYMESSSSNEEGDLLVRYKKQNYNSKTHDTSEIIDVINKINIIN